MAPSLSSSRPPPVAAALIDALASSVTSGSFSNVAYYLYSQRSRNGKVGKPKVVYANSLVMMSSAPYFRAQLAGTFSTDQPIPHQTESYEYDSDSDLDDAEDKDEGDEEWTVEPAAGSDSLSLDSSLPPIKAKHLVGPEYKYRIVVPNVASNSWQALIHFIYTGNVHFSPLKSEGTELHRSARAEHAQKYPHGPPLCSPKSIYRLANMIEITELKEKALGQIKARISAQNITSEVFSKFSSSYREILDMQLEHLYKKGMLAEVMPTVLKMVASVTQGQRPYCENVVSALLLKLSTLLSPQPRKPLKDDSADVTAAAAFFVQANAKASAKAKRDGAAPVQ